MEIPVNLIGSELLVGVTNTALKSFSKHTLLFCPLEFFLRLKLQAQGYQTRQNHLYINQLPTVDILLESSEDKAL